MMQRPDTAVFHEPLGDPFYFSQSRPCRRYTDEQCHQKCKENWNSTVEAVLQNLLRSVPKGKKFIFIKDMAQYIFPAETLTKLHPDSHVYQKNYHQDQAAATQSKQVDEGNENEYDEDDNPTVLPVSLLRQFKHTFLIRTPRKAVPSYWRCCELEKAAGFEYFDGAEAGYLELRLLYDWIANPSSSFNLYSNKSTQNQPQPPPLIDTSTLLANPEHSLSEYCKEVGIPFYPEMLSWQSGPVEEWEKWKGYHNQAENSTGFRKEDDSSKNNSSDEQFPVEVENTIRKCMPSYEYLSSKVTIHTPSSKEKKE